VTPCQYGRGDHSAVMKWTRQWRCVCVLVFTVSSSENEQLKEAFAKCVSTLRRLRCHHIDVVNRFLFTVLSVVQTVSSLFLRLKTRHFNQLFWSILLISAMNFSLADSNFRSVLITDVVHIASLFYSCIETREIAFAKLLQLL